MSYQLSRRAFVVFAASASVQLCSTSVHAAQVTTSWLTASNSAWTNSAAWSAGVPANGIPVGTTYSAVINATGSAYNVSLLAPFAIDVLRLDSTAATLTHSSGTLTTAAGTLANGRYNLTGGALSLSGLFNVTGGSFTFGSGTISGTGSLAIAAAGLIDLGTVPNSRTLSTTLSNAGNFAFTSGQLSLNAGTLTNSGTFIFNTTGSSYFLNSTATSAVTNSGTFAYGAGSYAVDTFTNSGTITVASGGTLSLGFGTITFASGSRVTGSGTLLVPSSTTVNLIGASTLSVANAALNGGTLTGGGTLNIDSAFSFNSGTISGAGSVIVASAATLNLGTVPNVRTLSRQLINNGTLNFTAGQLTLNTGTLINNNVFKFDTPGSSYILNSTATSAVVNNGTFLYGTGSYSADTFTNNGTVSIASGGTLTLGFGSITFSGDTSVIGAGTLIIPSSTTLNLTGAPNFITVGATTLSTAANVLNGGTITGTGLLEIDSAFTFNSGTITSTGTTLVGVYVKPAATLGLGTAPNVRTLSRQLTNDGTVNFTAGQLTLNSGTLVNYGTFVLNVPGSSYVISSPLTSAVVNNGTFAYGTGSYSVDTFTNNATVSIAAAGSLSLGFGSIIFAGGSDVIGAGTLIIPSSTTLAITGAATLDNATTLLNGGTISGTGSLTLNNAFTFNSGTISGPGSLIVSSTATLGLGTAPNVRTLSRQLTNDGTVNFTAGQLTLNSGTLINNGTFNFATPGSTYVINSTLTSAVVNNGTFVYGTGSYSVDTFTNNATISVASGGSLSLGFGSITFAAGSRVTGAGTLLIPSSTTLNVTGVSVLDIATVALNGGTISGAGQLTVNNLLTFSSGTLSGGGTFLLGSGATTTLGTVPNSRTVSRTLRNDGSLTFSAGAITLNAGTFLNNGTASFPTPGNVYLISGGVPSTVTNNGTFLLGTGTFNLGTLTNSGTIIVPSTATFTVSTAIAGAGTIDVSNAFAPTAALGGQIITGSGTLAPPNSQLVGATRTANLAVVSGATLTIQGDGGSSGTSRATNLSLSGARLNLTDNALVVDYDNGGSPGTTRYDAIRALVVSGRASGAWTGTGIMSSTAASTLGSTTLGAIGLAEASELFGTFPAPFAGQSVDSTTVLTRYTYLGDANLDRTVDTLDFARLVAGFATTGRWARGDFNYDGVVSSIDFNALAANYGKTVPLSPAALPAESPGVLVPEPAAIGVLFAVALLPRRRR